MFTAQQVGRYHLLDRIAFGGMAEIYRAKTFDRHGNEHLVAIKRVLRHLAEDDDFLQMLVDEAKIVSHLDHVNIAKVYELARVGEDYFIVMEHVDGRDVRTLLDRCRAAGRWLAPEHVAYVMMRTLEGLHAAHEKRDGAGRLLNIVHRDISPSNIIISFEGQVKLCDFGIAKATLSRVQTRTGVIKGKVKYMSPEQAMGQPLDRRSDLFSAGSVLYEMLTNQCPFQADNEMDVIFRVRDAKYPRPQSHNPHVPALLVRVLRRAMSRSTSGRYQSALELASDLRDCLQQLDPAYAPARLGRLLRQIFAEEIERDLRILEEFRLGEADPAALGCNLLAEVLGEGAAYTSFTPVAGSHERREGTDQLRTRMLAHIPPPEERIPSEMDLHAMSTQILDFEERASRVRKRRHRPRPGRLQQLRADQSSEIETTERPLGSSPAAASEAELEDESELEDEIELEAEMDASFHEEPTRILPPTGGSSKRPARR